MSHKFQKSCSLKCEAKDATTNNDWTFSPAYIGIMPLQMLLLKESDPSKYSLTDKLMDHTEERKKDVTYFSRSEHLYRQSSNFSIMIRTSNLIILRSIKKKPILVLTQMVSRKYVPSRPIFDNKLVRTNLVQY